MDLRTAVQRRAAAVAAKGHPEGHEVEHGPYRLRYRTEDFGERKPRHLIETYHGDDQVGSMLWYGGSGHVHSIDVHPDHQRKGLASAMWEMAQGASKRPRHSPDRTDQGDAWARSVGGPLPRRNKG